MSKILANQIANYGDNSPVEVKEGVNIPAGKPLQAAGAPGTAGQILSSTGTTIEWIDNFSGSYNDLSDRPTIPAAQVRADWNAVGSVAEILNKPIVPAVPSVTVNPPGSANLTYSAGNGQFTYTPPDLSSFATSVDIANSANWDTAYGWGDHAAVGYLTAEVDTLDTVTGRGASTANSIDVGELTISGGTNTGTIDILNVTNSSSVIYFNDVSGTVNSNIQGVSGHLSLNSAFGSDVTINAYSIFYQNGNVILNNGGQGTTQFSNGFSVTGGSISGIDIEDLDNVDITAGLSDQQVLKWDSASSSWKPANDLVGGAQGIQLVDLSVSTAPVGSAALSYNDTNGVFTYTPPDLSGYATTAAVANAANWDTAYGWGDHAAAGYLTAYTETDPVFTASAAAGITLTKINQWDTAYGWGNHANGGYLVATAQDKTNWNTAFGWGDHSTEGYLTAESDTLQTVLARGNSTSLDITTSGKIYYSNAFPLLTDLQAVSPVTYHGMFAHAHDVGHGYVAHAGAWIQLLDTGSSIGELADVDLSTPPSNGNVLQFNGFNWTAANLGSVANATISDTAPGSPTAGDLWWESDKGRLKIYYNDTDSQQWVDASPPLAQPNVPVAVGCINMNGFSPTWTGTTGYTVTGTQPQGAGTDYVYTLTFPSAYSARTDYIVQATFDGTNYVPENGCELAVARGTASVVFTPRRFDGQPLNQGEIMVTITNL